MFGIIVDSSFFRELSVIAFAAAKTLETSTCLAFRCYILQFGRYNASVVSFLVVTPMWLLSECLASFLIPRCTSESFL